MREKRLRCSSPYLLLKGSLEKGSEASGLACLHAEWHCSRSGLSCNWLPPQKRDPTATTELRHFFLTLIIGTEATRQLFIQGLSWRFFKNLDSNYVNFSHYHRKSNTITVIWSRVLGNRALNSEAQHPRGNDRLPCTNCLLLGLQSEVKTQLISVN